MLEEKIRGIVLKKQPLNEADELVTVYSKQLGKVRMKVQSSKKPTSRLSFAIQPGSIGDFRLVGKSPFYRLAGAEVNRSSKALYSDLARSQAFFIMSELVNVSTIDEQTDERAYAFLERALEGLEGYSDNNMDMWLCKFAWGWAALIGFDMSEANPEASQVFKNLDARPETARALRRVIMDHLSVHLEKTFKSLSFLNN